MPRAKIDARDLDDGTRGRLGLPPLKSSDIVGRDERAIARKRLRTGAGFEAELNMTHRQYELQRWGKIWPHSPPFVHVRGRWVPRAGGGPVDRTGHVRVLWRADGTCVGTAKGGVVVPVAFDAKAIDGHTYKHGAKQRHQLVQLRIAHETGVAAFLLVHCVPIDRVFLVEIDVFETDLLSGRGVRLYENRNGVTPFLPSVVRGATPAIAGWDWIPLLGYLITPPGSSS